MKNFLGTTDRARAPIVGLSALIGTKATAYLTGIKAFTITVWRKNVAPTNELTDVVREAVKQKYAEILKDEMQENGVQVHGDEMFAAPMQNARAAAKNDWEGRN